MTKILKILLLSFILGTIALFAIHPAFAQTPISYGQIVSGSISIAGEKDEFIFSGKKDDMIIILSTDTDSELFPYLELYDPTGAKVAESIYDIYSYKLQVTGSFKIILRDYNNTSTGNYKLALHKINNPANMTAINFGQTIAGTISSLLEIDVYAFTTTVPNEKVYISLSLPPGVDKYAWPSILLYDSSGKMIMTSDFAGGLIDVLPNVGTFYVVVDFGYRAIGNYEVTLKHWQDPTDYTNINFGQTISGELNSFKDLKVYKFSASANDKVYISLATLSQNSEDFSPRAEIYDSSYNPIPFESIDFGSDTFSGLYTTPQSGNFFIFISDDYQNGTGTYELTLQRPNNPANVTNLNFGQTTSGSIDTFTEIDVYKFTASANDIVNVRIGSTSSAPDHLRPYLELYDSIGTLIADSYDFYTGSISNSITQKLSTSGTFYLFVTSWYGKGTYSLSLQRLNAPGAAINLEFGQTVSGAIDAPVKMVTYQFSANANDKILINFTEVSGDLKPSLELLDSTGTRIASAGHRILSAEITNSGTHYLIVTDKDFNGTGTYELTLQRPNNPANVTNLNFGQTTSGSIDTFTDMDVYKFSASANDIVTACIVSTSTTSSDFFPYLQLYDSTGTLIADSFDEDSLTQKLYTSGTFYLFVTALAGKGTYSLSLQKIDLAGAITLNFGQTVSGTIDSPAKIVTYQFSANTNDKILINFTELTTTAGTFTPYLELYDANWTKLGDSSSGTLTATITTPGTHYLLVTNTDYDSTGTYELTLQRPNNPANVTPLNFGQTISGSIDAFTEIDVYKFSASANDKVYIRFAKITQTSGTFIDPYLELYDSTGTRLAYSDSGVLTATIAMAGNLYLLVMDRYRNGTGTYELTLQRTNNPANVTTINFGQTTSGTIATFTDIDAYSFTASTNDTITVRFAKTSTTSGSFEPYLGLYDATGARITTSSSGSLIQKFSTSGTFYLLVTDNYSNGTGTYSLSLQKIDLAGAITLNFGQTVSGTIGSLAKIVTYQFSADTNDKILINFIELTTTAGTFTPYLELYDATWTKLGDSSSGTLTATIATAGNLYLLVMDRYRNGTGTYELTLQRPNNPANVKDVNYDSIIEDSLEVVTGINVYRFTANTNDKITICSGVKIQTSGTFNLDLKLYNTTGTRLASSSSGSLKYTFTSGGTFYLFITDSSQNGTGVYRFKLLRGDLSCSTIDFTPPQVSLIQPKGGEIIEAGSTYPITWTSSDNMGITSQEIRLSTDSGATYPTVIAANLGAGIQSYNWQVAADLSTSKVRIKIIAQDALGNQGEDANEGDFMIIKTTLPNDSIDINYEYDKLNRLNKSVSSNTPSLDYTYDALGNRLTLSVAGRLNQPPLVGSINPASGASPINTAVTFTTTYIDSDGWQDIQLVYFLITNGSHPFCGYYNQNTHTLYIKDDTNRRWLGDFAPGSNNTIENSYVKLNCAQTTVSGSGNTLTVKWTLSFKSTFTPGTKDMYLYVKDDADTYQRWVKKGIWTIQP